METRSITFASLMETRNNGSEIYDWWCTVYPFQEYAAAGTFKQNYAKILLLLLRLRQACDHPLLVKGHQSVFKGDGSIEMAKKLSKERVIDLLARLEVSALCAVCGVSKLYILLVFWSAPVLSYFPNMWGVILESYHLYDLCPYKSSASNLHGWTYLGSYNDWTQPRFAT